PAAVIWAAPESNPDQLRTAAGPALAFNSGFPLATPAVIPAKSARVPITRASVPTIPTRDRRNLRVSARIAVVMPGICVFFVVEWARGSRGVGHHRRGCVQRMLALNRRRMLAAHQ